MTAGQLEMWTLQAARAARRSRLAISGARARHHWRYCERTTRVWIVSVEVELEGGELVTLRTRPLTWTSARQFAREHEAMGRAVQLEELLEVTR